MTSDPSDTQNACFPIFIKYYDICGPGSSVGIATELPGWTVRGGGEIFRTCPDRPWGPPSLLYDGYRVFPGGKVRPVRDADLSPLLVPWSRKSRAIPLFPLWAVRPVKSLSACTRVQFTLTFTMILISQCGPGSSVGIATELRAGRSGDRIPVRTRFSARPDRPWGTPSLLYNG